MPSIGISRLQTGRADVLLNILGPSEQTALIFVCVIGCRSRLVWSFCCSQQKKGVIHIFPGFTQKCSCASQIFCITDPDQVFFTPRRLPDSAKGWGDSLASPPPKQSSGKGCRGATQDHTPQSSPQRAGARADRVTVSLSNKVFPWEEKGKVLCRLSRLPTHPHPNTHPQKKTPTK